MERVEAKVIEPMLDKFAVSFISNEQYYKLPFTSGLVFYDDVELDFMYTPVIVLYSKDKLKPFEKEIVNEDEGYSLKQSPKIYPDFYIKNLKMEE